MPTARWRKSRSEGVAALVAAGAHMTFCCWRGARREAEGPAAGAGTGGGHHESPVPGCESRVSK
eukprot:5395084-Prymnesium_polylepis.1